MRAGICTTDFARCEPDELFAKIHEYGYSSAQFDFGTVCDEELPGEIPAGLCDAVAATAQKHGVELVAGNGTFNMIDPDAAKRADGVLRFAVAAAGFRALGIGTVTLCTGSRCPESMWKYDAASHLPDAWQDLRATARQLCDIAEQYDLTLAVETEASNIVDTPQKALELIKDVGSERLRIVMDAANLFLPGTAEREKAQSIIGAAFELLGDYIVLAHGKDIKQGAGVEFCSTGSGIVDYDYFLMLLDRWGYRGDIMLHGITAESEMAACCEFIQRKIKKNIRERRFLR